MQISGAVFVMIPSMLLLLAAAGRNANAQVTYTYTGNDFGPIYGTALTTSDFVSASFTFASPLADGLDFVEESANLLSWTVTDQINTLSMADADVLGFELTTNGAGDITNWEFLASTAVIPPSGIPPNWLEIGSANYGTYVVDLSEFWLTQSDPSWIASIPNDPGTWTTTTSAAPEPSTLGLTALLSVAIMVFEIRRRRQTRQPVPSSSR